jgi:hypothetical protein
VVSGEQQATHIDGNYPYFGFGLINL